MKKRYYPITAVVVVLLAIAVTGYLLPEARPEIPMRVLLENSGGPVVFDHLGHIEYDVPCHDCHHAQKVSTTEVPCGVCHPGEFDETFIREHAGWFEGKAACATCHHLEWGRPIFDHGLHEEIAGDCQSCHHDESIEPDPTSCRDCHAKEAEEEVPSLRDAVHAKCQDCHQEMFEEELAGCANCHSRKDMRGRDVNNPTNCAECHDKPNSALIPKRKDAFHQQCMGCHEKRGKGPYHQEAGNQECGKCHLPAS